VEECVEEILRDYERELERMGEPPEPVLVIKIDPVEELLKEYPELQAFGVEWVRKWLDLRERLVEIAKVMRRYPWMVDIVKQRPMSILYPYTCGGECYKGRVGGVSLAHLIKGVLLTRRSREGDQARAGI
jgi:hypothetical protein